MTLDQLENFINVEVAGTHTSGDTTVSLANGEASKLPDPANGEYNLVWYDSTNYSNPTFDPKVEIVRVTARDTNNDNVDVNRGQENTNASDKNSSGSTYRMALVPTAKTIEDIEAELNNITSFTKKDLGVKSGTYQVDWSAADVFIVDADGDLTIEHKNNNAGDEIQLLVNAVSVSFDPSNANKDGDFTLNTGNPSNNIYDYILFTPDGKKAYVSENYNGDLFQFSLSTAWDITSASQDYKESFGFAHGSAMAATFNDDGTIFYVSWDNDSAVTSYTLSTAYDPRTRTLKNDETGVNEGGGSISWADGGNKVYFGQGSTISSYDANTPYDISTLTNKQSTTVSPNGIKGVRVTPGGKGLAFSNSSNAYSYDLSTAHDLSTLTNQRSSSVGSGGNIRYTFFDNSFNNFFTMEESSDEPYVFDYSADSLVIYDINLSSKCSDYNNLTSLKDRLLFTIKDLDGFIVAESSKLS